MVVIGAMMVMAPTADPAVEFCMVNDMGMGSAMMMNNAMDMDMTKATTVVSDVMNTEADTTAVDVTIMNLSKVTETMMAVNDAMDTGRHMMVTVTMATNRATVVVSVHMGMNTDTMVVSASMDMVDGAMVEVMGVMDIENAMMLNPIDEGHPVVGLLNNQALNAE